MTTDAVTEAMVEAAAEAVIATMFPTTKREDIFPATVEACGQIARAALSAAEAARVRPVVAHETRIDEAQAPLSIAGERQGEHAPECEMSAGYVDGADEMGSRHGDA